MAQPLTASLPEDLVLDHGYTITFDAVDPTSGASVGGVTIVEGAVTARQLTDPGAANPAKPPGPYMLVPGPQAGGTET